MGRRALNIAALLSVVACLSLVGTWVVLRKTKYIRPFVWHGQQWEFRVADGRIEMTNDPQVAEDARAYRIAYAAHRAFMSEWNVKWNESWHLEWEERVRQQRELERQAALERENLDTMALRLCQLSRYAATFPLLAGLSALPAVAWATATWRRARTVQARTRAGYCRACGYDLQGSPYRCPECGKPVSTWAN